MDSRKKVALYSPYIPKHSGGGERYLLSIAEVCSWSHDTTILVPASVVNEAKKKLNTYQEMFGIDLSRVQIRATRIGQSKNPILTAVETKQYDVLFAMTDGSIFPTLAKKSYLIMQVPWTRSLSLSERVKLLSWTHILVYSRFVQSILQHSWKTSNIKVLSPYVDTRDFRPTPVTHKEKIIINVGRFFSHAQSNSKRQDILIEAFKGLVVEHRLKNWHLALLGNVDPNPDSQEFVKKLKELARGFPVTIHTDLSYDALRAFYARASIYWHAAGFGIDETSHPENTEHFGITTLEAMASGCVPFVVPKGGQAEILKDDRLFWNTRADLVHKTATFIHSVQKEKTDWQSLVSRLYARAETYSKAIFEQEVQKYL